MGNLLLLVLLGYFLEDVWGAAIFGCVAAAAAGGAAGVFVLQLTGVAAGLLVLAMLLFVPGLVQNLPQPALAAIVITASISLFDLELVNSRSCRFGARAQKPLSLLWM